MKNTFIHLAWRHAKPIFAITLLLTLGVIAAFSWNRVEGASKPAGTKLGIVIYSADAEIVWNAFRFGNFALSQGDQVKMFLLAKGVEAESLDTDRFKVTEMMKQFVTHGGTIQACGTCLKLRQSEGSELCPLSTMKDLYEITRDSDRVVTF